MAAQAWSADEWSAIVFHAKNARVKSAARALVPSTKSAARLRELALQTEIRGVPVPCVCTVPGLLRVYRARAVPACSGSEGTAG